MKDQTSNGTTPDGSTTLASGSGFTESLDASLKNFRKEQGDWALSQHLMNWLADLQRASKIKKGDYAGDQYRITIKIL